RQVTGFSKLALDNKHNRADKILPQSATPYNTSQMQVVVALVIYCLGFRIHYLSLKANPPTKF
ncbi:MAG: hypothetical protein KBB37_10050, partial [Bacteroidia bacterium]|nr:hypothetical protein [Bacteroidia bacterium]